jgi:hypothetical protein
MTLNLSIFHGMVQIWVSFINEFYIISVLLSPNFVTRHLRIVWKATEIMRTRVLQNHDFLLHVLIWNLKDNFF